MKKIFLLILLSASFFVVSSSVFAATPTATNSAASKITSTPKATPTVSKTKLIDDLKDRLATKVAELRDLQKYAVNGVIRQVTESTASIETIAKTIKMDLSDDVTVIEYLKGKRTKETISSLAKDDHVTVFGSYDATIDVVKPKVIVIDTISATKIIGGTISGVDKTDFSFTINTPEAQTLTIDFEKYTKTLDFDGTTMNKSSFSKLLVGQAVQVVGTANPKIEARYSATRIVTFFSASVAPTQTATPSPEASASATPKEVKKTVAATPTP